MVRKSERSPSFEAAPAAAGCVMIREEARMPALTGANERAGIRTRLRIRLDADIVLSFQDLV